jgi:hypothetical protein
VSTISGIVVVIAFWAAAGIYLWKMLAEGVWPVGVIAVVCFTAGGILRLVVLLRHRAASSRTRETESAGDSGTQATS